MSKERRFFEIDAAAVLGHGRSAAGIRGIFSRDGGFRVQLEDGLSVEVNSSALTAHLRAVQPEYMDSANPLSPSE